MKAIKRVSALAIAALAVLYVAVPAAAATAQPIPVESCAAVTGWYVNADEDDRQPTSTTGGFTFVGNDLVHHATDIALADLEPGSFDATPAPSLGSFFSVEIINASDSQGYATLRWDGSAWYIGGPKAATYSGHETDPATFIGKTSNFGTIDSTSHVISFGVGYVKTPNTGTATTVSSVNFSDKQYNLKCSYDVAATYYAAGEWQLRDAGMQWQDAKDSAVACETGTVTLKRSDPTVGASYENKNLGLDVKSGDVLQADYELKDGASFAVGAVRMFAYNGPDKDTWTVAPTFGPTIVDKAKGTAELKFAADAKVGTFGVTYDASNPSTGTVEFTKLRLVRGWTVTPIAFCAKPEAPTAPATTTTPAAETLPVTGSSLTGLIVVGVALVLAGAGAMLLARRRTAHR